jgi:hypothetical protein
MFVREIHSIEIGIGITRSETSVSMYSYTFHSKELKVTIRKEEMSPTISISSYIDYGIITQFPTSKSSYMDYGIISTVNFLDWY